MSHLILSNTMTTTTMTWKAGRLVCRASRLLRFGGCRCPVEGPGRHPVADLGRGRPVAVAHHGCSVWRSSNVFRQHQVFEIPVKRFDNGHLEFDGKERIIDHKKHVEDFKFGIWWKPCRSKKDADIEWKWMSHYIGTREICWSCPGWKRVLGHVVCHSQLAPQQLQRSLDEGRISIHQEKKCLCAWNTHIPWLYGWLVQSLMKLFDSWFDGTVCFQVCSDLNGINSRASGSWRSRMVQLSWPKLQIIRNPCKPHALTEKNFAVSWCCAPDSVVFSPNISGT